MEVERARRSLAGALDVYDNECMNRLRTVVDRFRHSNHEAERDAPSGASRSGFVRSEAGPHAAELSGVKGAGSAVGLVDAGIGAGGVLTSVRGAAQARVEDGIGSRCHGEDRGSRSWCSGQRTSNNRLKLTARGRPTPESRSRSRTAA